MVFIFVTIIILPLSFLSSFFAVGIASFPRDASSGEVDWPLGTLLSILWRRARPLKATDHLRSQHGLLLVSLQWTLEQLCRVRFA